MKTIRKKFLLLAFAAGAMFVIGNNVFADPTALSPEPGHEVPVIDCPGGPVVCARILVGNTVHIFYKRQD